MLRICLTGSIATGKTTVSKFMQAEGAIIIDTDLITHSIYNHPTPTSIKILEVFGPEYLKEQNIDRKKLGERVFKNPHDLELLNSIVHPSVRAEVAKFTRHYKKIEEQNNKSFLLVYVIPLFFESAVSDYDIDYIVVAGCSKENQFKRLVEREGYTEQEAIRRINSQIPIEEKMMKADYVIDNNQALDKIRIDVKTLLKNWAWDPYYEKD
jgi:dephospho-CoA kinase